MLSEETKKEIVRLWLLEEMTSGQIAQKLSSELRIRITKNQVIGTAHRLLGEKGRRKMKAPSPARPVPKKIFFAKEKSPEKRIELKKNSNSPPAIREIPLPAGANPIELVYLNSNQCRFIIGDPCSEKTIYCGMEKEESSSYCRDHHRLCYVPREPKKRDRENHRKKLGVSWLPRPSSGYSGL